MPAETLGDSLGRIAERLNSADPQSRVIMETLLACLDVVIAEAARTPRFSKALREALAKADVGSEPPAASSRGSRRSNRRHPGIIDPFELLHTSGPVGLRERLALLSVEQLKDVIAEHGMDRDRLAMKWKDPERLIERIAETAEARANKGNAFRGSAGAEVASD